MSRILLATLGSLGDLHPCIAVARALQQRGHSAVVASSVQIVTLKPVVSATAAVRRTIK